MQKVGMGNSKNMKWSHKCRGRYVKQVVPKTTNSSKTLCLNGSRIINLEKLKEHLQVISQHAATCQACADNVLSGNDAIILTGEKNNGLCSVLTSRCTSCHTDFHFSTSSKTKGISSGQYWECNLAAAWGQMVTGGEHVPLMESMTVLGVPSLTKKTFITIEKCIGQWWWTLFEDSLKQAGSEERAIAIANGRYHQGVPA